MAEHRPGIMIRFSSLEAIKLLSPEDAGRLFVGLLEYGQSGIEPVDFDGALKIVWSFLRPEIDADGERYHEKILQSRYAAFCREAKRRGETPTDFDTWKLSGDIDRCVPMSPDIQYNNNAISNQSNNNINPIQGQEQLHGGTAAMPPHTPARDSRGIVCLDDGEYGALVADLGEQEVRRCIDYLSEYCITHNKRYHDWGLMIRRANREGWGLPPSKPSSGVAKGPLDYQPSAERIQRNNDWLDVFLAEQAEKEGKNG